jgi:CBS domain-containing protein
MKAQDVMTRDVITVVPATPVTEAARLMVDRRISGLPVVTTEGRLLGIVSEADLVARQKERPRPMTRWRALFADQDALARDYRKSAGTTVGEIMSAPVVSVPTTCPIAMVAAILDRERIRRVVVLDGGSLVGIVTRGDLVRLLARAPAVSPQPRSDTQLVDEMRKRLHAESWAGVQGFAVHADHGVLVLWGEAASEAQKSAIETMARSIPGTAGVVSHLVTVPRFTRGVIV